MRQTWMYKLQKPNWNKVKKEIELQCTIKCCQQTLHFNLSYCLNVFGVNYPDKHNLGIRAHKNTYYYYLFDFSLRARRFLKRCRPSQTASHISRSFFILFMYVIHYVVTFPFSCARPVKWSLRPCVFHYYSHTSV